MIIKSALGTWDVIPDCVFLNYIKDYHDPVGQIPLGCAWHQQSAYRQSPLCLRFRPGKKLVSLGFHSDGEIDP